MRGLSLDLVKSYLDNKKQKIEGGNFLSPPVPQSSKVRVPQGSVLGPLLFLTYINNFHRALAIVCLNTHFADDSLSNVLDSCSSNFSVLNLCKTNFIIYGRKSNVCPHIVRVTSTKYL